MLPLHALSMTIAMKTTQDPVQQVDHLAWK